MGPEVCGRHVGAPPASALLAAIDMSRPQLGLFGRATVPGIGVALDSRGVCEVPRHARGQRLPVEGRDVGERGRHKPECRRHRLGAGVDQTPGGEECHRGRGGPQREVGLRVTVVEGTLRLDEAGQEIAVEILGLGRDANLHPPGSPLQGQLFLNDWDSRRTSEEWSEVVHHFVDLIADSASREEPVRTHQREGAVSALMVWIRAEAADDEFNEIVVRAEAGRLESRPDVEC